MEFIAIFTLYNRKETGKMNNKFSHKIKVLISADEIKEKVSDLGRKITKYYSDKVSENKPLVVVIIQKGASLFGADLVRNINLPLDMRFMRVSSYQGKKISQKNPEIFDEIKFEIKNNHVLVVEDVLDSGKTLAFIKNYLIKFQPQSLNFAVLLIKNINRKIKVPKIKFKAFSISDKFVVGYGLDYNDLYRNLPFIGLIQDNTTNH